VFFRDCFTPLITTKFRQAFEPHINHASTGPRRGALKPSGGLLIAFSGGLGPSVLLDLVHRVYCANVGSDELKGGKEHPRRNRVWEKIHVCYVETSDVFPEASQTLCDSFSPFSQTRTRRTTELRRFARLSPVTRDSSLFRYACKTRLIGAGGNEFPAGQLLVSQKCPLTWAIKVRPIGSLKGLSKPLHMPIRFRANCRFESPSSRFAHPYSYSIYAIHPDEIVVVVHSLFYRRLASGPGHVSYFVVDIPDLLDISRGRLRRAAGNTGRVDPTFCQEYSRSQIVEWRGSLNTAAKRC
jgi:hypothetical protein